MVDRRRRFLMWLLPKLIIFAAGVGLGFYARDSKFNELQDAYDQVIEEVEQLRQAGEEAVERGQEIGNAVGRAGEAVKEAIGDSTR